jgi:hypothetical protein
MTRFARLAVALLAVAAFARPASAVDYTDIWWNPFESGWGVNFVQSNNFIFATFFVYGPGGQPTWYTGQMTRGTGDVWAGPLYATTGTYFGSPWNGAASTALQVGTATFVASSATAGTLTYNVNAVAVTKQIQRQTLTAIPLGGRYSGAYSSTFSGCANAANNGTVTYFANLTVTQTQGGALTLTFDSSAPAAFSGPFVQEGTLTRIPNATYQLAGQTMAAAVTQIKATAQGIEGTWTANVNAAYTGCVEQAYFSLLFLS